MEGGAWSRNRVRRGRISSSAAMRLLDRLPLHRLIHCGAWDHLLLAFTLWCCCGNVGSNVMTINAGVDGRRSVTSPPDSEEQRHTNGDELTLRPDYYHQNYQEELRDKHLCLFEGRVYPRGKFQPEPCIWCECTQDSTTNCWAQTCPLSMDPQCIRYKTLSEDCCPTCVEMGCMYNGTGYKRGASIHTGDTCRKCYCPWEGESQGNPVCLDLSCPAVHCVDPHTPSGKCCPVCRNGANCWLKDQKLIIPAGRQVWVDKCHVCHCPELEPSGETSKTESNNHHHAAAETLLIGGRKSRKRAGENENEISPKDATEEPEVRGKRHLTEKFIDPKHAICVFEKSYACNEGE